MVEKIPENQLNAINNVKAEGISAEELKKLEMLGVNKELLDMLSGTKTDNEVDEILNRYMNPPEVDTEKGGIWDWIKENPGKTGAGAAITLGILGAVLTGGVAPIVIGGLIAGVALLTGCSDNNVYIDQGDTEFNATLNVDIKAGLSLEELKTAIKDAVAEALKESDGERNKKLDEIIDKLKGLGYGVDMILAALTSNGATLNEILEKLGKNTEAINLLAKGNETLAQLLNDIKNNQVELTSEQNKLLTEILNKMNTLGELSKEDNKLLNLIISKLDNSIANEKEMDDKTNKLLLSILENIQNFNGDVKAGFANILESLDKQSEQTLSVLNKILNNLKNMSVAQKEQFKIVLPLLESLGVKADAILEAINNGNELNKDELEAIKNAILQNNDIAQGTQNLVKDLLGRIDKLGDKADIIIDTIGKIGAGETVDLSLIEDMLQALLEQSKANGDTLSSVDNKMNFIKVSVDGIKDTLNGNHAELMSKLDEILAKIPENTEGCKCEASLTIIIEKLQNIIDNLDKLKEDPKHEGILDDLKNQIS